MMRRVVLLALPVFLVSVLFLAGTVVAAPHICAFCKKPITGNLFVETSGKYYHPKHFRCFNCGEQIKASGYFERDQKLYDSACYIELFSPRCDYCGKPMPADYITVQGKKYHEYCYNTKIALRCSLCGRIIEGPYLVDYYGNRVHKAHKGKAAQCEYCGRFISPDISKGSAIYADGREVCGYCSESIVKTEAEALALTAAVCDTLAKEGIKIDLRNLVLMPVDKVQMAKQRPPRGAQAQAFTCFIQSKRLYGLLLTREFKVYVLDRLPKIEFVTTIAHELMHVWLGQNADFKMDETLSEGSCNYAAFLALRHYGKDAQYAIDKLAKDEDPVYGEGFRKVALYAEKVSTAQWLEYLKKNSTPPWLLAAR